VIFWLREERFHQKNASKGYRMLTWRKWRNWIYVIGILAIMTAGIFATLRFGYVPSPVPVMSVSTFSTPEDLGVTVFKRFFSPISQYKLVVFGVPTQPEYQRQIIRGFIKAAADYQVPFDVLVAEADMPRLDLSGLPPMEVEAIPTNSPTQAEFVDKIQALRKAGKRILVYVPSVYSTHLLVRNPIDRYEKSTGEHLFAITSETLSLNPNQERLVDPPCTGGERDSEGTAALGCAVMQASRGIYRKNLKPTDHFIAIMNSPKPEDYLLMTAAPGQQ
jgi:hypothetical protein